MKYRCKVNVNYGGDKTARVGDTVESGDDLSVKYPKFFEPHIEEELDDGDDD